MALFLQILGGNLFVLWGMGKVLGDKLPEILGSPYAELYLKYSWLLLTTGISLVLFSQILKLRKRRANRDSHRVVERDDSNLKTHSISPRGKQYRDLPMQVDWSPLSGGGSNYKSSDLKMISNSRIEIKSSSGSKFFSGFFILLGIGIPGVMGYMDYRESGLELGLLFPLFVSLAFVGVGILMLFFPRPRYLDKRLGWFWAGKKSPSGEQAFRQLAMASPLKELVALQIVAEEINGKNMSYTSWEINIIHEDGTRYNVIDHGNKNSIDSDANIISEFLSIPILVNEQDVSS